VVEQSALSLNLFFKCLGIVTIVIIVTFGVSLQNVTCWEHVSVFAFIASVWTHPIETVQILFHCVNKGLARDNRIRHSACLRSWITVDVNACLLLLLNRQVVRVLALLSLFAHTSFEVAAERVFEVDF